MLVQGKLNRRPQFALLERLEEITVWLGDSGSIQRRFVRMSGHIDNRGTWRRERMVWAAETPS
jgi:hypothetical protein